MSDPRNSGPISAVAAAFADEHAKYRNLPLTERNVVRARIGGFLMGLAVYTASDVSSYPQEWQLGWAVCGGIGLLLLVIGLRGSRGCERDPLAAIFAVAVPLGGWIALSIWLPDLRYDYFVRGFFVALVASNAVQFFTAIRGSGGKAQKIIEQQIAQHAFNWKPVKR